MPLTRFDVDLDGLTDGEVVSHLLELHALKARLEGAIIAATDAFERRGSTLLTPPAPPPGG